LVWSWSAGPLGQGRLNHGTPDYPRHDDSGGDNSVVAIVRFSEHAAADGNGAGGPGRLP
jgi:hypothetical protein